MLITQLVTQSVAMILFSSRTITFNYNNSDKLGGEQGQLAHVQYQSPWIWIWTCAIYQLLLIVRLVKRAGAELGEAQFNKSLVLHEFL